MNPYRPVLTLLFAFSSATFAQTLTCPLIAKGEIVPSASNVLPYPMTSDRYAVEYSIGGGPWTPANVYISYYGGTLASPWLPYSGYTAAYKPPVLGPKPSVLPAWETSLSFVSITIPSYGAGVTDVPPVQIRVTNLLTGGFATGDLLAVRPASKGIDVGLSGTYAMISRTVPPGGEQFVLWWERAPNGGDVEGLAFFLNPDYGPEPSGPNVMKVTNTSSLQGIPATIDILDFEGTVNFAAAGLADSLLVVPPHIKTLYFGENSWVQGKLRFEESGYGDTRLVYGPGVLDVSRFDYNRRHCHGPDGYPAKSLDATANPLPANSPGIRDQYTFAGVIVSDTNFYATDLLDNATINNVKTIGWNGNNDGLELGTMTSVNNVFVRSGDDSLKMWGAYTNVTNATVWQNFNGGVINLGWFDNSPGENSQIDGVYVVKTDWIKPAMGADPTSTDSNSLQNLNNAVIDSEMVPGTQFGLLTPSLYKDIFVEGTPRVLFSLKIVPPRIGAPIDATINLQTPSLLNLNIQGFHAVRSPVENFIGFQKLLPGFTFLKQVLPPLPYILPGTMNIGLYNVDILNSGIPTQLTAANAWSVGEIKPQAQDPTGVTLTYGPTLPAPSGPQWYSAWAAPQGYRIDTPISDQTVRMIVEPTVSGSMVRVKLENTVGSAAVTFTTAYFGQLETMAAVAPAPGSVTNNTQLFFNGSPGLTLEPGHGAYSDPLPFPIIAFSQYAVSLDVQKATDISSHLLGLVTNYIATAGGNAQNASGAAFLPVMPNPNLGKGNTFPVYWVSALDVQSTSGTGGIVALGDSITDGQCSTRDPAGDPIDKFGATPAPNEYLTWPDLLAVRLAGSKAVVNEGIAGNHVAGGVSYDVGQAALARIANDVLGREGATHVILLEGTNDIADSNPITLDDITAEIATLEGAYSRAINDAHLIGLNIIGATILPRGGDPAWTSGMDLVRNAVNDFIRSPGIFDGVIDFDGLLTAGTKPDAKGFFEIPKAYSCFDGTHPNADGYAFMAANINLTLFDTPLRPR